MLFISLMFGIAGLFVQWVYIQDWWHPLTITNTLVGFEDFLFGWIMGGIAAVVYEEIANKKLKREEKIEKVLKSHFLYSIIPTTLLGVLFFGSFFILKTSSFLASIIGLGIPIFYMWIKRKDMIVPSLLSAFLLALVGLIWFLVPAIITPGWVKHYWFMENLSGITFLSAPIEDLIWFFLTGAFIGPLWEYLQERKLINLKKRKKK
jgi:hypothetical protein